MKFVLVLFTLCIVSTGSHYIKNRVQRDRPDYLYPENVDPSAPETKRCHLLVHYCNEYIIKSNPEYETPCSNAEKIRERLVSVIEECALILPPVTVRSLTSTKTRYEECLEIAN